MCTNIISIMWFAICLKNMRFRIGRSTFKMKDFEKQLVRLKEVRTFKNMFTTCTKQAGVVKNRVMNVLR